LFEELGVFGRGVGLGLMIAAPVGPVGLLCIRRTAQKGLLTGFASGFGAAFADALFSALAAFGVAAIIDMIRDYNHWIHVLGGTFMLFVAWHTWRDKPRQPEPDAPEAQTGSRPGSVIRSVISSFVITLTNPATLFGVLAVVATFGGLRNHLEASTLVGGIFTGSALWWFMLSGGVALVRSHFTEARIIGINRVTAVALAALAAWALTTGVMGFPGLGSG
jgi:threonine/homoserine/homoserine lactone efflux protein